MVERLLILLSGIAVTLALVEAGNDATTKRSFTTKAPGLPNKWTQPVDLIPQVFLPGAHDSYGHSLTAYLRQVYDGSVTPPEGGVSGKEGQELPPLGASRGVLEPGCLRLLRCHNENDFYFDRMEIHHADLPERSAAACGHLCLRQRPHSRLVVAKLSPFNEQLVCGCGDQEALPTLPVATDRPQCLQPCPDGGDSCGGPGLVSVYLMDRDRKECLAPVYSYHGCYHGEVGEAAVTLGPWERWAGGCRARCKEPSTSGALMRLTSAADGTTLCECWVTEAELGSAVVQEGGGCGWRCPDGEGWCGGAGMTSVYSAGVRQLPTLSCLLLVTLVLAFLWFLLRDVLA
ncbi:hypothetical protein GWK47_047231 [Chionoecetes opilio]|uniref:Uncharacterized protein n=1 Tax=Chionoecetes opilio TaxID=41210 RepID=A0A8J5CGF6_CHIOP|nr:hypothetical protein GWK47_047231 [Chionoecetes opilio]